MTRPSPASVKTERMLNLVIALLHTRVPMTKHQVRNAVEQYASTSDEAFERTFERDKDELRALGVPIESVPVATAWDDEVGYRIQPTQYALPEVHLTAEELAVVGLATKLWEHASLSSAARLALRKLEAQDGTEAATLRAPEVAIRTREPSFDAIRQAVLDQRRVTFGYRKASDAVAEPRTVEPYALTSWRGRWYLSGRDVDRDADRVFRLSRIEGDVTVSGHPGTWETPDQQAVLRLVSQSAGAPGDVLVAAVRLAPGVGQALRLRGREVGEQDGWSRWEVPVTDLSFFASEITELGPGAVVLDPPELREAVAASLRGVLEAHTQEAQR